MKLPKSVIVFVLIAVVLLIGWKTAQPTYSLRYKITVEVETPEGLKTGSAVSEVTMRPQPELPQGGAHFDVKGEAVVIDLGKRGTAFAVMGTDDYWMFFSAFAPPPPSGLGIATEVKGMKYYQSVEGKKSLELKDRPLIVAFKDINDPKTVEAVYRVTGTAIPNSRNYNYQVEDNLEELFGQGVRLKEISIERTNEKVSRGVEKWLPWLTELKQRKARLNGKTGAILNNDLNNNLGSGSFSTER